MKNNSRSIKLTGDQVTSVKPNEKSVLKVDDLSLKANQAISKQDEKPKLEKTTQRKEINGPKGLEPTRYGDWESKGRCYDF